jgi:HD-GYP domain-containing protein (c-di-GMP phosphodiesterase class II)
MSSKEDSSLPPSPQRALIELSLAYDATVEGFGRALDLREGEPVGHTSQVTEMTIVLAKEIGLGEAELVHIKRGALLHDIGKMGISEQVLLKPGPLTQEEWVIMHMHPQYAYDLLAPIIYLYPALDIPYCHHEKWNGTGYPRGLKGNEIPLAARIFAVIDVWDALTSARPYRAAWSEAKARQYIQQQSGSHFDPEVVKVFQTMKFLKRLTKPLVK